VGALFGGASGGDLADQGGDGLNPCATDEVADDAPDGGVGCGEALLAQDRPEFLLAPHGMIETQPLDGLPQPLRACWLADAPRSPAGGRGALGPTIERGARDADGLGGLLARQSAPHRLPPSGQRVASSGGFDIWGLRRQKTRRALGVADNIAGQAKNLHGVLLAIRASTTRTSENPSDHAIGPICI